MRKILDLITDEMVKAFEAAGLDAKYAKVTVSNRPDLCEYQCNGAMAGAKKYKKAPIMIANAVVEELADSKYFASAEAVNPGFINLKVSGEYMAQYLEEMRNSEKMGVEEARNPQTMILDYGGLRIHCKHIAFPRVCIRKLSLHVGFRFF